MEDKVSERRLYYLSGKLPCEGSIAKTEGLRKRWYGEGGAEARMRH